MRMWSWRLNRWSRGAFEFVNEIRGGAIPTEFIPSVERGVKERMDQGILAGYR